MKANRTSLIAISLAAGAATPELSAQVLYSNGPLSTGATTQSNVAAPAGGTWSEVANDTGQTTVANAVAGFSVSGASRIADNFVVPAAGAGWIIHGVRVAVYQPGATVVTTTAATLRIWDGPPNAGGVLIFGDTTTNRLSSATFSNIHRCFNTIVPAVCGGTPIPPTTDLRLQFAQISLTVFLPPGTYWIDYNVTGASLAPMTTLLGTRQAGGVTSNAIQFNGSWVPINDPGQGCGATPVRQESWFELLGFEAGAAPCYANCDNSTVIPCLNVNDFICFMHAFSLGLPYANCDASVIPPVLNANDFNCFLSKFGLGCGFSNCSRRE